MADQTQATLGKLEETLELYLVKKAPFQLPQNVKELIVKFAPWVTIVVLVITLPLVLFAFGLGAVVAPFAFLAGPQYGVSYGLNYIISMVVLGIALVLELMAVPGLFSRSAKAWRLVYWATLITVVSNILTLNIISGLLSGLISLYFLFQVKSLYK